MIFEIKNNAVLSSKQCPGSQTSHNSGSRSPFDTLTSALDRKFQTASIGHSFRARFQQNNIVLTLKKVAKLKTQIFRFFEAGVWGRQPPAYPKGPPVNFPEVLKVFGLVAPTVKKTFGPAEIRFLGV